MGDEIRPFKLVKEFSSLALTQNESGGWDFSVAHPQSSWEQLGVRAFCQRLTIDLGGLSSEGRTLFFEAQVLQRPRSYIPYQLSPAAGLTITDQIVVSCVALEDYNTAVLPDAFTGMFAGFSASSDEFNQTLLGEGVQVIQNANILHILPIADAYSFGSNEPTAASKLYLYRWILINQSGPAAVGDNMVLPPVRYLGVGVSGKEADLVYIERLRRSYEAQQQV